MAGESQSFSVKVFWDFLSRASKSSERKICLIVDNHSVHRAKAVKECVSEDSDQRAFSFAPFCVRAES